MFCYSSLPIYYSQSIFSKGTNLTDLQKNLERHLIFVRNKVTKLCCLKRCLEFSLWRKNMPFLPPINIINSFHMKSFFTTCTFLLFSLAAFAQQDKQPAAPQHKWMKDEKNVLTVSITKDATKAELLDLKKKLLEQYQIKFECPQMEFRKDNGKLRFLGLRVELPTGELGTVSTNFIKPGQVIGFHFDRNDEAYDVFGVWTK